MSIVARKLAGDTAYGTMPYEECVIICTNDSAEIQDTFHTDDGFFVEYWYSPESNTSYQICSE